MIIALTPQVLNKARHVQAQSVRTTPSSFLSQRPEVTTVKTSSYLCTVSLVVISNCRLLSRQAQLQRASQHFPVCRYSGLQLSSLSPSCMGWCRKYRRYGISGIIGCGAWDGCLRLKSKSCSKLVVFPHFSCSRAPSLPSPPLTVSSPSTLLAAMNLCNTH
jgi:hypothetical protein